MHPFAQHTTATAVGRSAAGQQLLTDPLVLILDEATSALDPGTEHEVLGALAEESALLAEGGAKADERYMSRVAHLAPPPPSPPKGAPPEESKA